MSPPPDRAVPGLALGVLTAAALLAACQPLGDPLAGDGDAAGAPEDAAEERALTGPLEEVLEASDVEARAWSGDARLIDLEVALDAEGAWREVTATYVAAGVDELLEVVVAPDPEGAAGRAVRGQTVRLATLGLDPLPAEAVADLPGAGALVDPDTVVERAREPLEACDGSPPVSVVRYTTGALAAWDEDGWTLEPRWRLTARGAEGVGVSLDAATGQPEGDAERRCVPAPPEPDDDVPAEVEDDPGTPPLVEPPEQDEDTAPDGEAEDTSPAREAGEQLDPES